MQRNILTTLGLTAFFILIIVIASSIGNEGVHSVYARVAGSPGNYSGSPSDGNSCVQCHTGSAVNSGVGTPSISAPGLVSGYVPGQTYTITASIIETGIFDFGFQVTAERDANNAKTGTFILTDAVNTRFPFNLTTILTSITHTNSGTAGFNSRTWTFDWTAPGAGTGSVTFYGSFNSANGTGQSNGDKIYTTSLNVIEGGVGMEEKNIFTDVKIYPNPTSSFIKIFTNEEINNLKIYNIDGQIVLKEVKPRSTINVQHLSSGVYFVQLSNNERVSLKKLLIQ